MVRESGLLTIRSPSQYTVTALAVFVNTYTCCDVVGFATVIEVISSTGLLPLPLTRRTLPAASPETSAMYLPPLELPKATMMLFAVDGVVQRIAADH